MTDVRKQTERMGGFAEKEEKKSQNKANKERFLSEKNVLRKIFSD